MPFNKLNPGGPIRLWCEAAVQISVLENLVEVRSFCVFWAINRLYHPLVKFEREWRDTFLIWSRLSAVFMQLWPNLELSERWNLIVLGCGRQSCSLNFPLQCQWVLFPMALTQRSYLEVQTGPLVRRLNFLYNLLIILWYKYNTMGLCQWRIVIWRATIWQSQFGVYIRWKSIYQSQFGL